MSGTIAKRRILQLLATILLLQATATNGSTAAASAERSEPASKPHRPHDQYSHKLRYDVKLFEGDIVPDYAQMLECYGPNTTAELVAKGILSDELEDDNTKSTTPPPPPTTLGFRLWPTRIEDVTVIPYEFATGAFSAAQQTNIRTAMQDLARQVRVIQFVPRRRRSSNGTSKKKEANHHLPYLRFTADKIYIDDSSIAKDDTFSCWAEHVGWNGGSHQAINLGEDFCVAPGPVMHLLLHTLGSWEPTSRWDRDDYVTIIWENVMPGLEFNLRKRIRDDTLGFPYFDYGSIMNNGNGDYSINGNDTILAPEPIGQLDHLSAGDVLWVRLLYQCRSGPRLYGDYIAHPCTEDCPCWQYDESSSSGYDRTGTIEVNMSCGGNDAACQGNLVCLPQINRCFLPRSNKMAETVAMWSTQVSLVVSPKRVMNGTVMVLVVIVCFCVILLLSLIRAVRGVHGAGFIAPSYRRGYETIP